MESHQNAINNNAEKEISLKDLILQLNKTFKFLLSKWKLIVLCGLIGAACGITYSLLKKTRYVAELSFVLEDTKSSPLGAYAGIASQFGIDLGGSSGSGVFSGDNVIEFLKSRFIIEKTLLSSITIEGKNITLADYYISFSGLKEELLKKEALRQLNFPIQAGRKSFSRQQDSVLNVIYKRIVEEDLNVNKPDKKLSFINVRCVSIDEVFSKIFTERVVKEATDFYVATKTKRSLGNINKLQEKADSIESLLNQKTYSAAISQDLNQNPARRVSTVNTELIIRDKTVLLTMYSEVVKNLELSKVAFSQDAPILQIVDSPILPLKKEKLGKLKGLITGGVFGGLFICLFLVMQSIFKSIMND